MEIFTTDSVKDKEQNVRNKFSLEASSFFFLVGSYVQFITTQNSSPCIRENQNRALRCSFPVGLVIKEFDFDSIPDLDQIEMFIVTGINGRGPLTSIPKDICRLKRLKVNIL